MSRLRWLVPALLLVLVSAPGFAGRLSDLPWDDKIPQDVRGGVRRAMTEEAKKIADEKNEQGKKYVRALPSVTTELQADGRALAYMTLERCLPDKMVVERWRYTLAKKGTDFEIVARDKVAQNDDFLADRLQKSAAGQPVQPFTFTHDLLTLKVEGGSGLVGFRGPHPNMLLISGKAHVTLKPLDDYEAMFFQRRFDRKVVDSDVSEISIDFHEEDDRFLKLSGVPTTGDTVGTASPDGAGDSNAGLHDLVDDLTRPMKGKEFTPYVYTNPPRAESRGWFSLRMKTADHGWIVYRYSPTAVKEIEVFHQKPGLPGANVYERWQTEGVSEYYAPETRALPLADRERRRPLRLADAARYDAMIDIEPDLFTAQMTVDLSVLAKTKELFFQIGGKPVVHHVTLEGQDLLFEPIPSAGSTTFGFEETYNRFRVLLPREVQPGELLRFNVRYAAERLVYKVSENYWEIARGGFLPFTSELAEPSYMHFVIRTEKPYDHVSIGSKLGEEVDRTYRYTEWGSTEHGFNFPTLAIGRYFDLPKQQNEGITYSGYMHRQFEGLKKRFEAAGYNAMEVPEPTGGDMERQVEQAKAAAYYYGKWFNHPYAFKDLKLVSSPMMGMSAQSPSSIVYIGEYVFWSDSNIVQFMPTMDPSWAHSVTAHETAHQWFGGQVSNITGDHYWFVETFAELSAAFFREAIEDKNGLKSNVAYWKSNAMSFDWHKALIDDVSRFEPGPRGDVLLRYTKGPIVFWQLRDYYSPEKLLTFLRGMIQLHGGDLISTSDVQVVAEKAFGEKMDWFFDQYVRNVGIPEVKWHLEPARQAEDGKGWIVTGKLQQSILLKGDPIPGRVFKHLLVPITFQTDAGPRVEKIYMDEPEKEIRIRLESRPKGSPKVDTTNFYMTAKEF